MWSKDDLRILSTSWNLLIGILLLFFSFGFEVIYLALLESTNLFVFKLKCVRNKPGKNKPGKISQVK